VKEMLLQEAVYLTVVVKLSAALPNMLDPIATSILHCSWKTLLHSTPFNLGYKRAGGGLATEILLKRC
jgi:hypothetical protein